MRPGIRLQLVVALGVLLAVAFVPLYFAVAKLTEASLASARREAARDLGRAISGHVLSAHVGRSPEATSTLLEAQLSDGGVVAIALYDAQGVLASGAGQTKLLPESVPEPAERVRPVKIGTGDGLLVTVPGDRGASVAIALAIDPSPRNQSPLVRLVALYTGVVALALLIFAYLAMTRLVVRPIDALQSSAARVMGGGHTIDVPSGSGRELHELGASLRAMTEQLRADEESMRNKIDELERTARELVSAQDSLVRSERLASVGRLAAGMAHEIGNPIAALLGFEELLLTGDLPPEEQKDFLIRMKRETDRIHRVLRNLLDFARAKDLAETGGTGPVDVAIESVLSLVAPQSDLKEVEITRHIDADLPLVSLTEERLEQVILNLVLNAADAVPRPGGKIRVTARRESGGEAMAHVAITIEDNGPGIAISVRDKLFEPFVTTKEVGKGTGLGLAVCRGIVEAAGGSITTEESDLGGARFVVKIPVAKEK